MTGCISSGTARGSWRWRSRSAVALAAPAHAVAFTAKRQNHELYLCREGARAAQGLHVADLISHCLQMLSQPLRAACAPQKGQLQQARVPALRKRLHGHGQARVPVQRKRLYGHGQAQVLEARRVRRRHARVLHTLA